MADDFVIESIHGTTVSNLKTAGSLKVFLCLLVLFSVFEWTQTAGLWEDCSSVNCTNSSLVCDPDTNLCKVRADGRATDCNSTDNNCPSYAACSNDTCSCNPGTRAENGLCTVIHSTVCSTNSDCTGVPGPAYQCIIVNPCTTGVCMCADGYFGWNCLTLGLDQVCDPADDICDVNRGLACDNTTLMCACSVDGATYKAAIGACTIQSLFGESCTTVADCHIDGACNPNGTCGCASGYYPKTKQYTATYGEQSCRPPHVGEACTSTCQAVGLSTPLVSDVSQGTPTCSSSQCVCGTGYSIMSALNPFVGCTDICVADTNATAQIVGGNCTSFNECGSGGICLQCPGDAAGKCYTSPCAAPGDGDGGSSVGIAEVNGITLVMLLGLVFDY